MLTWVPSIDGLIDDATAAWSSADALRAWRNRAAPLVGYLTRDGRAEEAERVRDALRTVTQRIDLLEGK